MIKIVLIIFLQLNLFDANGQATIVPIAGSHSAAVRLEFARI